jgi:hypothetical protein
VLYLHDENDEVDQVVGVLLVEAQLPDRVALGVVALVQPDQQVQANAPLSETDLSSLP